MLATIGLIAHWMLVVGLSIRVIMRRRPVGVSLSWIAILSMVPIGGAFLYLLVGENRLGQNRARRMQELREPSRRWLMTLSTERAVDWNTLHPASAALEQYAASVIGIPALAGNALELLEESESAMRSIIADIDQAERTVHLEFYIWSLGGTADDVVDAVIRAAERGVSCRVLLDASGSKRFLRSESASRMRRAGVNLTAALPVGFLRVLFRRLDVRIHRKIVVVDGKIGYTGSLNLADAKFFKRNAGVGHWVDAMVRIEGPAVEALEATFLSDWHIEGVEKLESLLSAVGRHSVDDMGPAVVQVVPSGPRRAPESIHQMLLTTIYSARRELVLTTPYFVPDEAMIVALISAARRGVDVTIVVPENVDSLLVRYASRSNFEELLLGGVRIVQYREGLLHAKTVTVDRSIALVGSVNLDMRSFWLNFEITLFVYDTAFAGALGDVQARYVESSREVDLDEWRKRGPVQKFFENLLRLMGPVL